MASSSDIILPSGCTVGIKASPRSVPTEIDLTVEILPSGFLTVGLLFRSILPGSRSPWEAPGEAFASGATPVPSLDLNSPAGSVAPSAGLLDRGPRLVPVYG